MNELEQENERLRAELKKALATLSRAEVVPTALPEG